MNETTKSGWQPSKPLARGSAAGQILEDLREQILSGRLARGTKLPTEKQLADSYGVSGTTIREAIRGLTTMQLVDVRHGSGAYVTAQSDQLVALSLQSMIQLEGINIAQVLGVLGALNTYAAELAVANASDAQLALMDEALKSADHGATIEEIAGGLRRFLDVLAEASSNPLLTALSRFLAGIQITLAEKLAHNDLNKWRAIAGQLATERRNLYDALRSRDVESARACARAYHDKAIKVITAIPEATSAIVVDPAMSTFLASLLRNLKR